MNIKPDVVNFHFVDFCNYSCSYCFVKKISRIASFLKIKNIVDNLNCYFKSNNVRGRINLVGGEVFMCNYFQAIIDYIFEKGIDVSLVTNGSLLTKEFIEKNKEKVSSIGISVDSLNEETNIKIGRCCNKKVLSSEKLVDLCRCIKKNQIKLKINHCVSKYNVEENIEAFINEVKPDRFKIFQMTVVDGINENAKKMQITNDEFNCYCNKYLKYNPIIENEQEMKSSYIIIDSDGEVFIDRADLSLGNAMEEDMSSIIEKAHIDEKSYQKRYVQLQK